VEELASALDPTVRTEIEAGFVASRTRFTRAPRKWSLRFDMTKTVNKNTIAAFATARGIGGEAFTWYEPVAGELVSVRFQGPPTYIPAESTGNTRWTVSFVLEEV
jgi:phage-related protein